MDRFEMVEKLREKARVSYEEASDALEKCRWDLLDALLLLEREGKVHRENEPQPQSEKKACPAGIALLLRGIVQAVRKLNAVQLLIKKSNEVQLELNLTAVLLLLLLSFWGVVIVAVLAMLFGCRFAVAGLSFDASVNDALSKAGKFLQNVIKPGSTHKAEE